MNRTFPQIPLDEFSEETIHARQEAALQPREEVCHWHLEVSVSLLHKLIEQHGSPVRQRIAQLFYSEGRSVATISAQLGICPSTVASHLRRFRLIVEKTLPRLAEERGMGLESA